jgi:hypothetical protein
MAVLVYAAGDLFRSGNLKPNCTLELLGTINAGSISRATVFVLSTKTFQCTILAAISKHARLERTIWLALQFPLSCSFFSCHSPPSKSSHTGHAHCALYRSLTGHWLILIILESTSVIHGRMPAMNTRRKHMLWKLVSPHPNFAHTTPGCLL